MNDSHANRQGKSSLPGCLIIGNGPGPAPVPPDGFFVRFNLAPGEKLFDREIRICNRKQAGLPDSPFPFLASSPSFSPAWCEALQQRLAESALALEGEQFCLPSAGLATVHAMLQMGWTLQLQRMPLRPSMLRATSMSARQPLAAVWHNWLGERRLAWQWRQTQAARLRWPDLLLALPAAGADKSVHANPYPALIQCLGQMAGKPSDPAANRLRELAAVSAEAWCLHAEHTELQALERFFYLRRDSRITANWWLYRNDLSPSIDRLMRYLMQAQQFLAMSRGRD